MYSEEIIPRRHAYSNEMMWHDCELMKKVVNQTIEQNEGRGKSTVTVLIPKHKVDKPTIDRLDKSCEYYKEQHQKDLERMKDRIQLRDYQKDIVEKGYSIILEHGFLYLAMEVRTGKTLTSLSLAEELQVSNVLFLTKKKAISSIQEDVDKFKPSYHIEITNYESMHHVVENKKWDLVVCDEAHSMGAFAKPSDRAKQVRDLVVKFKPMVILLSGTPTPESYSQMYHQIYGIPGNPFREFRTFYRFCDKYVDVKQKKINGLFINDYSRGKDEIIEAMKPYMLTYSQEEAGFLVKTTEEILEVDMKQSTYDLIDRLKRDLVIKGKDEVILADTSVKLMMKVHQLSSGTIKFESGKSMVVDLSKAEFIKEHFDGFKIGIFYKFKEELSALKQVFEDMLTTEIDVFKGTDKPVIALQIVSGREGISLKEADYLVYYNIDFSATSYWQSRDRMTTKERLNNHIYWVFSRGGIEHDIYKAVSKKKDFTVNHFKRTL